MKVVVGIGNPGERYASTRHNVGFMVIDELASRWGPISFRSRFDARVAEVRPLGERTLLVKPQTFVNESGRALRQAADWYGVAPEDILVVVDDFNLPLGVMRARRGGSSGGHRGIESIAESLASDAIPRLRLGIGSELRRGDRDFVLSPFAAEERDAAQALALRAADGVEIWLREGIERCMNVCNARPAPPETPSIEEENA